MRLLFMIILWEGMGNEEAEEEIAREESIMAAEEFCSKRSM
jgi:hypothetical protein